MPSKKKTFNYFERQQKKLHPKKYRFYFFDYMYYCGEKWGEKSFRISGMIVFFSYWSFCFVLPLSLYLSSISVLSHTDGWHIVGVMAFGIIPPVLLLYTALSEWTSLRPYATLSSEHMAQRNSGMVDLFSVVSTSYSRVLGNKRDGMDLDIPPPVLTLYLVLHIEKFFHGRSEVISPFFKLFDNRE